MTNHTAETTHQTIEELLATLLALRTTIVQQAQRRYDAWQPHITRSQFHESARNLAHYLALRRHDLREVQAALRPLGLSSLGRIEAQVMANLDAVIVTLARIAGVQPAQLPERPPLRIFQQGEVALEAETAAVFGPRPSQRRVRLMITLPSEAARNKGLVRALVANGMNVARINCAHDGPEEWTRMIDNVRRSARVLDREVRVAMDLGGPKVRTIDIIQPKKYRLVKGDTILLTSGTPPKAHAYPVKVGCTAPQAIAAAAVGARVWFDDGKIGAVVRKRVPEGIILEVTHASLDGDRLKDEKGINFPDTALNLPALTPKDLSDLDFITQHADIINYSFVQQPDDIRQIQDAIAVRAADRTLALILKIETATAVANLPELIALAAGRQPVGVMIARGDLAVEIGFERMAEMQEEILWVCEAAHVPVVWATQVLETLAKTGRPSRAEMTDAAMSERAECVMLNKGPYILDAMGILDSVLQRMEAHQSKKFAQLRALQSWGDPPEVG